MSTVIAKNIQIGTSGTPAQNFTWYQPASPDGTVRLGVGNTGATTLDAITATSAGNVTVSGSLAGGALSGSSLAVSGATTTGSLTVNSNNISAVNSLGFRNRIINGDMRIDQRNNGGAVVLTGAGGYPVDRFFPQVATATVTTQRSSIVPAGFVNSLACTVGTGASPSAGQYNGIKHEVEGFNTADFGFGTANAQSVTLSFWVRSSVTGTYAGRFANAGDTRVYVFTYSISSANTWEYKTVTIAGDTSGTWATDNSRGIQIIWDLGSGSNFNGTAGSWGGSNFTRTSGSVNWIANTGATFYITGVQLEAGTVASPFERRDYGRELIMCQRYYEKSYNIDVAPGTNSTAGRFESSGASDQASNQIATIRFAVAKRAAPTMSGWTSTGTSGSWDYGRSGASGAVTVNFAYTSTFSFSPYVGVGTGWVPSTMIGHWVASAEL